jgi:tetratricopeptide (TPR) repeat protein
VHPAASFCLTSRSLERLERVGVEFLGEFFGRETARHPENLPALVELACILTRLGRYQEGLACDLKLAQLAPEDPTVHYNLACSLALLGHGAKALDALERSIDLGYDDPDHLLADGDLKSLWDEPRFRALVVRLGGPIERLTSE